MDMMEVEYTRIDLDEEIPESRIARMSTFLYDVVGITESAILPPLKILNKRLISGGQYAPYVDAFWSPFELTPEEYNDLCTELGNIDPTEIGSDARYAYVKIKRAEEFDLIKDDKEWSKAVNHKFQIEFVAEVMAGVAVEHKLLAEETSEPRERPEVPNLQELETTLFDLSSQAIRKFYSENSTTFYAFGIDCNAIYGDVLLCTNTEDDFQKTAEYYIENWDYTEERLVSLRRNFGDWKYQGFNFDYPFWQKDWGEIAIEIESYVHHEAVSDEESERFVELLLQTFSKVLIRLEQSGELDIINKDSGFYVQLCDHDEDPENGDKRLAFVRQELAKLDKKVAK